MKSWCEVVFLMALGISVSTQAGSKKNEALLSSQTLIAELEQNKKTLEADQQKQKKALQALGQMNERIKRIVKQKARAFSETTEVEVHLDKTTRKLQELETQMGSQKVHLAERLRILSRVGGSQLMGFLMSSISSSQLERNLKILGLVINKDRESIKGFQQVSRERELEKEKMSVRLRLLNKKTENLHQQELNLAREQALKETLVRSLRKNRLFQLQKMADLKQQSKNLPAEDLGILEDLLKPSFFEQKGQLPSPTEGILTRSFGIEKDPRHDLRINHKGVFFSTPEGSAIRSVFDGQVSFAGALPGFGPTVIVDHGDHFYTVYAYNQKLEVSEGQEIKKLQKIAHSGFNSDTGTAGVYFEIRHFSEADDPQKWMKGRSQ